MKPPEFEDSIVVDDIRIRIRTLWPSDAEIEQQFVRELSDRSRYYRFHSGLRELSPAMLDRFINVNYPNEMALIATIDVDGKEKEIGVARYIRPDDSEVAEMAIVIADAWQGKGVGTRLLVDLRSCAIAAGIKQMRASVLSQNRRMYELARKLGFTVEPRHGDFRTVELGTRFDDANFGH